MSLYPFSGEDQGLFTMPPFHAVNEVAQAITSCNFGQKREGFAGVSLATEAANEQVVSNENLIRLCQTLCITPQQLVLPGQTHSARVMVIDEAFLQQTEIQRKHSLENCDGLVTGIKNIHLAVLTADCLPLVFYDAKQQVAGIVHAGWKGTAAGIATNVVETMVQVYQCNPQDILVGMGPSISVRHYEVGTDFAAHFAKLVSEPVLQQATRWRQGKVYFDLHCINRAVLEQAGILPQNVYNCEVCTYASERFFSYRKNPMQRGRMVTTIAILD